MISYWIQKFIQLHIIMRKDSYGELENREKERFLEKTKMPGL